MDLTKVAVFGTRHILAEAPLYAGQEPVYDEWFRGEHFSWYSTGKLEEALAQGLDVYVVSIRPVFGRQDQWWLKLVGDGRAYNARRSLAAAMAGGDAMEAVYEPWKLFFGRLGVPWPENTFTDFDDPAIWLASRHGVRDGSMFRGHTYWC